MLRSYLYAPAIRLDLMTKALASAADAVMFDLEDAVAASEKDNARQTLRGLLQTTSPGNKHVYVRLNSGETAFADLDAIPVQHLAGVRIAKTEDPDIVRRISVYLEGRERLEGLEQGAVLIEPIVETVRGVCSVADFAKASLRVKRVAFGAGDLIHDLSAVATPDRAATLYARSKVVMDSRLGELLPPVAHVYGDFRNLEGLRSASLEDRTLGFFGRSCIHPMQIEVIHQAFAPSEAEVAKARRIADAYATRSAEGIGSFALTDGTFIDEAVYKRALATLSRANEHGAIQ